MTIFHPRLRVQGWLETEFVNVKGVQESIPPGWESIPGLLKRFKRQAQFAPSFQ